MARDYDEMERRSLDAETLVVSIVTGLLCGFFATKGAVYLPAVVVGFLRLEKFLLVKFYLAANIGALMTGSIFGLLKGDLRARFDASRITNSSGGAAMFVGACCMGVGMAIAAAEPGFAFVQLGTGHWSSLYILLGGVLAVVVYGLLYDVFFSRFEESLRFRRNSLDDMFSCNYAAVALPLAVLLSVLCYFMETRWTQPWSSEAGGSGSQKWWIPDPREKVWHVYATGVCFGVLMTPLRLSLRAPLDSTCAYISPLCIPLVVLCNTVGFRLPSWFTRRSSTGSLWVLIFFVSALGGGTLAASLSGSLSNNTSGEPGLKLLGGFFLVLGALIGGSDTSGMALSGLSDLNLMRILGTVLIYGCGVAAWAIMKKENIKFESQASYLSAVW